MEVVQEVARNQLQHFPAISFKRLFLVDFLVAPDDLSVARKSEKLWLTLS